MSSTDAQMFRLGNGVLSNTHGTGVGPMRVRGPVAGRQPSVDSERGLIRELSRHCPVPCVADHGDEGLCSDPMPLTVSCRLCPACAIGPMHRGTLRFAQRPRGRIGPGGCQFLPERKPIAWYCRKTSPSGGSASPCGVKSRAVPGRLHAAVHHGARSCISKLENLIGNGPHALPVAASRPWSAHTVAGEELVALGSDPVARESLLRA